MMNGQSTPGMAVPRTVVMVGLMGAGKSAIGRRLATRIGLPFVDADAEIEAAAGCTIDDFFARYGESAFREGERRVMARLLSGPVCVLAAGGGAFIDSGTRAIIRDKAVSVWLRADLEILVNRTSGRGHRPLLNQGDPRETLRRLIEVRYPIYAEADITVDSVDDAREAMVQRVVESLERHFGIIIKEPDGDSSTGNQ
ncbi:MAG: shikimate kinase [Alphaproteobacteria bacterium]